MMSFRRGKSRSEVTPRPLDPARIEELAIAYVARFGTTRAKLRDYLRRKLAERGWAEDGPPADIVIDEVVARLAGAGYVDDAAYARAKSGSLLRRGYGGRRVAQALGAAGVEDDVRAAVAPGEAQARQAALALARKRRFGPFGASAASTDRAVREKQLAAMLRAGHPLESARALIGAVTIADAEAWAYGADDDPNGPEDYG